MNLSSVIFSGRADFGSATFSAEAYFGIATFSAEATFRRSRFSEIVDFSRTSKGDGEDVFWRPNFTESIFEKKAIFTDASLDPCFESTTMNDSALKDVQWPSTMKLHNEVDADKMKDGIAKMEEYRSAIRTYFFLRTKLNSEGDYKDASDFFYRERLVEKKLLGTRLRDKNDDNEKTMKLCEGRSWLSCFFEWIWLSIFWFTCGFGERVLHSIAMALISWFGFSAIFLGLSMPSTQIFPLRMADALFISLAALSNLGFDQSRVSLQLSHYGTWLYQIEGVVGIVLASLFLVVFVRKMSRQ